ncbi:uncharacterized protein METZ01_LOCUS165621 [marine metagenome]|uniref:Uncharacterized protein n=1 Tax=marine metagenome TaxID=408172 RepID=A0A382BHT8_9ZZZZ
MRKMIGRIQNKYALKLNLFIIMVQNTERKV